MSNRSVLAELFTDAGTTATALHVAVLEHFGSQIYDWDPLTLDLEIRSDFGMEPVEACQGKLAAIITAVGTDQFYGSQQGFYNIASGLDDGDPKFEAFEPLPLPEALWAIYEVALNRDPEPFSPMVEMYLQHLMKEEGMSHMNLENPEENEIGKFLFHRREQVRSELTKLHSHIPELPDFDEVFKQILK